MPRSSWDPSYFDYEVPRPEVEDLENEVVGGLLGPNEEPIFEILERATVPMGFKPYEKVPSTTRWYPGWEPGG